ncbi:hypothetical protein B0H17DRAFT_1324419 [Mycena rosella]|uniref:Protection of telomeres protein 1 n=1 Tax=Mycena rosella TaxID=1033263 RepID=A0AAD7H1A2_MYCRO|nr:hypothetical protein B0H17DRAFT_1324419 [Mycena rosella]
MKRAGDELDRDSKRSKRDTDYTPFFNDPQQEKSATDLLTWTSGDSGYIAGKIHMKWDLPKKFRIIVESFSVVGGAKQFDVEFPGRCFEALRGAGVAFKVWQEIRISLRGAKVVQKKGRAANPIALPILLEYSEDVALEISPKGQESGRQIDTFFKPQAPEEPSEIVSAPQDAWFLTPKDTSRPALFIGRGELMDIDEEPPVTSPSPAPLQKSASSSTIAPLHNIGNSLPTPIAPRHPQSNHPASSLSSSRPLRPIPRAQATAGFSTPNENPPSRNDLASGPSRPIRPPHTSTNHASTSKVADRKPAAREVILPPPLRPPHTSIEPVAPEVMPSPNPLRPPNHASTSKTSKIAERKPTTPETVPPPILRPVESEQLPTHATSTTPRETTEDPEPVLNKKQRKNKMRKEKKKAKADLPPPPAIPAATTTSAPAPAPAPAPSHSVYTQQAPSTVSPAVRSIPQARSPPQSQPAPSEPAAPYRPRVTLSLSLSSGLLITIQLPPGFTRLSEVTSHNSLYSIVGVVTYITTPSRTRSGDLGCSLRVVDPSNCIESFPPAKEGFTVNCFTKKYAQWLPAAQEGDIIILHNVKAQGRNGSFLAVGYHDKLKWAVYSPLRGRIGQGDLPPGVPRSEGLDDGYGAPFSPFYDANAGELAYCVEVSDWWRNVKEKRDAEMGTVHQIGGTTTSRRISAGRQHQLISEIPDTGVYFDCTVEVCHGYDNGSYQPYSLYVTDYTNLSGGYMYQQDWCPPKLGDRILKIEMWDSARSFGPDMRPGEFYALKNVRAMTSKNGYREAKIAETKIEKLDSSRADDLPHLKALLERKAAFGLVDEVVDSKLTLVEQGNVGDHMTCVVELLHTDEPKRFIYVSDYTRHPKISAINQPWARGLDGYVLKVLLDDEQAGMIQNLVVGQYYTILYLRLQQSVTETEFRARIGGSARLIHPINPKSSSVAEWKENLIERRNKLKYSIDTTTTPLRVPKANAPQIIDGSTSNKFMSIKDALSTEYPGTFCVRGRVIDFFPFRLDDSFVRTCTKCSLQIPPHRAACFGCNDIELEHVQIVSILRLLISDGSDKLKISVSSNIPLLAGLPAVILGEDPDAARIFSERLKPLLGNLVDVHDAMLMKQVKEPNGPMMTFTIDSWKAEDGDVVYGLLDYQL